ncbi:hypothetical protein HYZ05_02815 [Candidatus Daviesbacteria bacterium]|nr:hypothetical protein [Candidatus Daviesbacteria bacterium]
MENSCDSYNTKSRGKFENLSVPCYKLDPLDKKGLVEIIKKQKADILLIFGWLWFIPKEIFEKYLTLTLHISPLPKYRGGSPLQHQIIAGEKTSAVTIFKADAGLDSGPIYGQSPFSLKGSLDQIFKRIINEGTSTTLRILRGISNGTLQPVPQDPSIVTTFKRRKPEQSELTVKDFQTKTSDELYNFIRSLANPYPNAYIVCKDGKKIFFTDAHIEKDQNP